jgi:thiol-disulfide isomerase/thioredoxin
MKISERFAMSVLILLTAFSFSCATAEEVLDTETESTEEMLVLMPELRMPEIGESAPSFEISTIDGEAFSLKEKTEGKVVSIIFWSLFCAPCRRSMPILNSLHKEHGDEEFALLAVNMDGEHMLEGVKAYIAEEGLGFTILMDEYDGESMKVADPYGVQGTPTTYVIDKFGNIAFSKVGDVEQDEFEALVVRELNKPRMKKDGEE